MCAGHSRPSGTHRSSSPSPLAGVAIAPDGLSWIVYQPVNRCVTFEATRSTGGLRIAKLPQGRTELRLDGNEPRLVCDTVMPPSDCEGWGGLENITIEQLAPAR